MKKDVIVFGAPDIQEAEIREVIASLEDGWLGTGPKVMQFERDFAQYKAVAGDRVAAVSSCTAALHLALLAAGVRPGDEVVTTAMTFCATVNAIIHTGATPVLADIDRDTLNIDPALLEEQITSKTRAILPVHFAGRSCDMDAILSIAAAHDLKVIEDCAHAIETEWRGQPAGTLGDFGCFSFYANKNVTAGEGGLVVGRTDDVDRIKVLAMHGMSKSAWRRFGDQGYKHYQVEAAGFKYGMMDLQAAIAIHQLARIEQAWQRRRDIWDRYQQAFDGLPIGLPAAIDPRSQHARHLYTITVDSDRANITRDGFLGEMGQVGIGVGVHYQSLAQHPYYRKTYGWQPSDCPNADRYGSQTVSLPLSPKLTDEDVERVIVAVKDILTKRNRSATS